MTILTIFKALDNFDQVTKNAHQVTQSIDRMDKQSSALTGTLGKVGIAMAGAFTVGAVVAAGKQVIDFAGQLTDLSGKTGISTTGLQKLDLAFSQAGVSLDTVASNVTKFQKTLIGGDASAVGAMQKLGLSVSELKGMAPDQAFLKVADAVGRIQNPAEKSFAAMTIFGKGGAEMLSAMDGNLTATTEKFEAMGLIIDEKTVKAADDFGDQLGLLAKQGMALIASVLGPILPLLSEGAATLMGLAQVVMSLLRPAIDWLVGNLLKVRATMFDFLASVADAAQRVPLLGKHLGGLSGASDFFRDTAARSRSMLDDMNTSSSKLATTATQATTPALIGLGKSAEDVDKATKKATEQQEKFQKSVADATTTANLSTFTLNAYGATTLPLVTSSMQEAIDATRDWIPPLEGATGEVEDLQREGRHLAAVLVDVNKQIATLPNVLPSATGKLKEARDTTGDAAEKALKFRDNVHDLAGAFVSLAQVSGDSFGGIVQDIGRAVAAFDMALQSANAYRNATTNTQRGVALIGAASSVIAATGSGSTGSRVASGAAAGAGAGAMFGPIGMGVGAGVGALVGWLRGRSASAKEEKEVRALRSAFIDAAGGLEHLELTAARAGVTLDKLLDAKKPKDYEAAVRNLNAAIEFQDHAMQTLKDTVSKYGFELEELGPALQKQGLDEQAQQIFKDFQVLTGGGIEAGAVIRRMADTTNDYIHNALNMGIEVPAAMKPMLQRMAEMGLLTDENGTVIKDLEGSGIKFAETMTQGFDRIVTEVKKLVEAIERGLNPSLQNIPNVHRSITISPQYEGVWPEGFPGSGPFDAAAAAAGGYGGGGGVPPIYGMAEGGFGRADGPAWFFTRGNEDWAFSGEGRAFSRTGDTPHEHNEGFNHTLQEIRGLRRDLQRQLPRAVALAVRDAVVLAR